MAFHFLRYNISSATAIELHDPVLDLTITIPVTKNMAAKSIRAWCEAVGIEYLYTKYDGSDVNVKYDGILTDYAADASEPDPLRMVTYTYDSPSNCIKVEDMFDDSVTVLLPVDSSISKELQVTNWLTDNGIPVIESTVNCNIFCRFTGKFPEYKLPYIIPASMLSKLASLRMNMAIIRWNFVVN